MNLSRTSRVRLLAGSAAGTLALAAVMALPTATASAAPAAPAGASTASADLGGPVARAATRAGRVTKVSTQLELRRAVALANQRDGADRIDLTRSISLSKGNGKGSGALTLDIDVTSALSIFGGGNTINGRDIDRVFDVAPRVRLELNRISLRNASPANAGESGGAIRATDGGQARLAQVTISGSEAVGGALASGGAIMNDGGRVVLIKSTLSGNRASRAGGGIEANGGTTVVRDSQLTGNATGASPGNGGALHLTGAGKVVVNTTRVTDNTATAEGGGLWNSATGDMTVRGSTFTGNTAAGAEATNGGGALYNDGGTLTVGGSTITTNTATGAAGSGGGVLNVGGTLVVNGTTLRGNQASRAGGGIESAPSASGGASTVDLNAVNLTANSTGAAPGNGGGLHLTGAGTVTYDGGSVTGNTAANQGGGLWNSAPGTMRVTEVAVTGNTAPTSPNAYQDGETAGGFTINNNGTAQVVPTGNNPAEYPNP